jgi:hypothetical protein
VAGGALFGPEQAYACGVPDPVVLVAEALPHGPLEVVSPLDVGPPVVTVVPGAPPVPPPEPPSSTVPVQPTSALAARMKGILRAITVSMAVLREGMIAARSATTSPLEGSPRAEGRALMGP